MFSGQTPIRSKLMKILLLATGSVLLVTCSLFFVYEYLTFRQATVRSVGTLGQVIAANSTAALAFANPEDAKEILAALKAEPQIVAAALYDSQGNLFAEYAGGAGGQVLPSTVKEDGHIDGYAFKEGYLSGFQAVVEGQNRRLGTLYLKSDMSAMTARFRLYGGIVALVMVLSFGVAYLVSRLLQKQISEPILGLAETARAVSDRHDYSVRAAANHGYELNLLTDAFNHMLAQIQSQHGALQAHLGRLDLLQRTTRAISERLDLQSIFQVVVRSLEDNMPIDFGCVGLYDPASEMLTLGGLGARSQALTAALGLKTLATVPIDAAGLARCVGGELLYEPDIRHSQFSFTKRLAEAGMVALVAAPLLVESKVFGVLLAARREANSFSSGDCEFLRQLSEHVALAAHQTQLYDALQQAYDDLRQSQHTALQQERLRALGQMASGIAHDINNAISPVSLYTESLLEREPNLSKRTRDYLVTIQRAVDDVAETVARMREFYRHREPERVLAVVALNRLAQQVIDLTRARWSAVPQERGIFINLRTEFDPDLPTTMGAESEIRDALTNLLFNAVDAMPEGGTLTVRTRALLESPDGKDKSASHVAIEICDTGTGMDEETRKRCLEPFFTTKGERGTGLGLAMVYGMVQRHSAELEIDSAPGQGTTMRLVFAVSTPVVSAAIRHPAQRPNHGYRILLVDDDPMLIKSLRDTLETDGHFIVAADGGQAGIEAFSTALRRGEPFDIVVTDLGMPYVDGRKVAATIKAESPATPIILLTGWGRRLLAENDIPPHVDRVLSKPPRLHELRVAFTELTAADGHAAGAAGVVDGADRAASAP